MSINTSLQTNQAVNLNTLQTSQARGSQREADANAAQTGANDAASTADKLTLSNANVLRVERNSSNGPSMSPQQAREQTMQTRDLLLANPQQAVQAFGTLNANAVQALLSTA